jgi:hypothetical protein
VIVAAAAKPPTLSPRTRRDEIRAGARSRPRRSPVARAWPQTWTPARIRAALVRALARADRDPTTADPEAIGQLAVDPDATPVEPPAGRCDATITVRAPTKKLEQISVPGSARLGDDRASWRRGEAETEGRRS